MRRRRILRWKAASRLERSYSSRDGHRFIESLSSRAERGTIVECFTNTEEEAVGLTKVVPFLVEDELKAKGGHFTRTDDWGVYVMTDGLLITGQNPASSAIAAKSLRRTAFGNCHYRRVVGN